MDRQKELGEDKDERNIPEEYVWKVQWVRKRNKKERVMGKMLIKVRRVMTWEKKRR